MFAAWEVWFSCVCPLLWISCGWYMLCRMRSVLFFVLFCFVLLVLLVFYSNNIIVVLKSIFFFTFDFKECMHQLRKCCNNPVSYMHMANAGLLSTSVFDLKEEVHLVNTFCFNLQMLGQCREDSLARDRARFTWML